MALILGWASLAVFLVSFRRWIAALKRVEIPENRGGFVAAWATAAGLGGFALVNEPGWIGGVPAGLGTFGACFVLFTIAIGKQRLGDGAIRVGASLPSFTAPDEHGQLFDSASLVGHPVLIKFFRGHW